MDHDVVTSSSQPDHVRTSKAGHRRSPGPLRHPASIAATGICSAPASPRTAMADYPGIGTWESADAITAFMTGAHAEMGHTMHRISNIAIDVGRGRPKRSRPLLRRRHARWRPTDRADSTRSASTTTSSSGRRTGWRIARRNFTMVHFRTLAVTRGPFPRQMDTSPTTRALPPRRSWRRPPRLPAAWPVRRGSSFSSPESSTGARAGEPKGATSLEAWIVERCGVSLATARAFAHVAEQLERPAAPGRRALVGRAQLRQGARRGRRGDAGERPGSGRAGAGVHGAAAARGRPERSGALPRSRAQTDYEARSVRFNDTLPHRDGPAAARVLRRGEVLSRVPGPGAPLRRRDPMGPTPLRRPPWSVFRVRSGTGRRRARAPYVVVVHAPLETLADESSELAGELERDGLISAETVRRLACDATVIVARRRRRRPHDVRGSGHDGSRPTPQRREIMRRDRHCRFPGCTNVTFTNVHHVVPWKSGGRTDLDNLVLLCEHHHHRRAQLGLVHDGQRQRGADLRRARPDAS